MADINDILSSKELFYDENSFNVPLEAIKADVDYRVMANKDLVGAPYPVTGIYNEDGTVAEEPEEEDDTDKKNEGQEGDENV